MMKPIRLLCMFTLMGGAVLAQEVADPNPPSPQASILEPTIPVEELSIRLKPLTKERLKTEADAWQQLVQNKAQEISDAEIAGLKAGGEEAKQLAAAAAGLREARTQLVDRQKAVLSEWLRKGASDEELKPYQDYLSAVSGLTLNPTKPSSSLSMLHGWVVSKEGGIRWGINLVKFLFTLAVTWIVAGMVGRVMRKITARTKFSELFENFIVTTSRNLVKIFGIIIALSMLEVNVGPLLAGVGVLGFIVGFALQDTLGNFAAGFMILLYRPYDVGDFVAAGGVSGTVVAMSLVSTTFKTPDNQKVVVPNGKIWGDTITNTTGNSIRRVDLVVGCSYDDDLGKVQRVLEDLVRSQEAVLADPEPFVSVIELSNSSVNFAVRPWVNTADHWTTKCELTRRIKERFDEEGISIPYPTQKVHLAKQ